jgi:hypothetical protein
MAIELNFSRDLAVWAVRAVFGNGFEQNHRYFVVSRKGLAEMAAIER